MSNYENWDKQTIDVQDGQKVSDMYQAGYKFGRTGKGDMYKSRLLRVDLGSFELSSENRRVLRKVEDLKLEEVELPIRANYDWKVHKLGKDFYSKKFGEGIFTASRLKKLLTDDSVSNFNLLLRYKIGSEIVGYAICYMNNDLLHYTYPFYEFERYPNNLGMAMMLNAIDYAIAKQLRYVYLGSVHSLSDKYKLQFKGLEWYDSDHWSHDSEKLKNLLTT